MICPRFPWLIGLWLHPTLSINNNNPLPWPAGKVGQVNVVTPDCPQAGQDLSEGRHDEVLRVTELWGEGGGAGHGARAGHVILTARLVEEGLPPLTVLQDETLAAIKWGPSGESIQWSSARWEAAVNIKTEIDTQSHQRDREREIIENGKKSARQFLE